MMNIPYDKLLISCGSKTNTFNTPGLYERENKEIFFLKHLSVSCFFVLQLITAFDGVNCLACPLSPSSNIGMF